MTSDETADRPLVESGATFETVAEAACQRLARNERIRRVLPGEGRLRIDRQLPFLCVYRAAPDRFDPGTSELVTTQAAYLVASGDEEYRQPLAALCRRIGAAMREHYGTFLFLEVWAQEVDDELRRSRAAAAPAFEIVAPEPDSLPKPLDALAAALSEVTVSGQRATVSTSHGLRIAPPGLRPLESAGKSRAAGGSFALGLAVRPIYRDPATGTLYPLVLQRLRSQLARALRKAIAQFTGLQAGGEPMHYDALGPSSMVKAARIVDQELSEVAESFDFLLQATPTNCEQAWQEFSENGYQQAPALYYRPLPYHPSLLKRRLFAIEIERVEDPTLAQLFWEKQNEVDRQLTALRDLNTSRFLYTSLQLYGAADDGLLALAEAILARKPPKAKAATELASADELVQRARDEIDYYHQKHSAFDAKVEVCDDIAAGTMVSRDRLLVARNIRLRRERVEALLHHEVGTHLLTYFNGRSQPFRQLYAGLAGYEELQEGLAVLAEYLTGGLTAGRLRVLAARVVAVRSMCDGASLPATFARLHEGYGFPHWEAFVIAFRVHRAGGLTKDVIYLRGLRDLLRYLGTGHDIEPLYVGKIGLRHLPYVQEMRRRGILHPPSLLPRFWNDKHLRERLEACRGLSVLDLLETRP